jgi:hypothetical protein
MTDKAEKHLNKKQKQEFHSDKSFGYAINDEFVHNLQRDWENKLLIAGAKVLTAKGDRILKSKAEIRNALKRYGEVLFFARGNNNTRILLNKIKKPAHLCWN